MKLFLVFVLAAVISPASGGAATNDRLKAWFGSQTCPALDGLYSKRVPPPVKTGSETLVFDIPTSVLWRLKPSLTVPWYVYDPKAKVALSHVGGDSDVVFTLRVVKGAPPSSLPTVNLSEAHTTSGLKIGSSAKSVVRVLGKPLVIDACGLERYEYSDSNIPDAEQNDLDFTIKDGRVIEIVHTSWG